MKIVHSKRGSVFVALLWCLNGCGTLRTGDCVKNDDHVWRVTAARLNGYTVQEWVDGKWGTPTDIVDISYRSDYVKVTCPS
jgi:hypothetical protein